MMVSAPGDSARVRRRTLGALRRLSPLEWVGIAGLASAIPIQMALPWNMGMPFFLKLVFVTSIPPFLGVLGAVAVGNLAVELFRTGPKVLASRRAMAQCLGRSRLGQRAFWVDLVRIVLVFWIILSLHFTIKVSIHLLNPKVFDPWLWRYDSWLGLGHDPALLLVQWIRAPLLLRALDYTYSVMYPMVYLLYPALIIVASRQRGDRLAFASAFCFLWLLGSLLYVIFPSWGPVFTQPDHFERTLQSMPITVYVQQELFVELQGVIQRPFGPRPIKYGGVAAFPSLHVAVIALFTLASRRISRWWFYANLALLAAILVGSMVTGYHYLFDGLVGLLLALVIDRFFGRAALPARSPSETPMPEG